MVHARKNFSAPSLIGATLLGVLFVSGCGFASQSQVNTLQAENSRLGQQSKAQLAEIENLKTHSRKIEDQLIEAEDQLALHHEQNGTTRRKLASLRNERKRLEGQIFAGDGSRIPLGVSGQLANLAQEFESLQYDPQTGISKLDTDVLFDSGSADLKPGAEKLLRQFVEVLETAQARDLKIMVVGHTDNQRIRGPETRHLYPSNWHLSSARALSVADRLRAFGLQGDRMGIAGFGQHQAITANDTSDARQQNRRVEIFIMSPEVPIVGMTETLTNLY